MYKNIEKQRKLKLKDQIEYQPGQVVSKTLVQNDKISMTIFSFIFVVQYCIWKDFGKKGDEKCICLVGELVIIHLRNVCSE